MHRRPEPRRRSRTAALARSVAVLAVLASAALAQSVEGTSIPGAEARPGGTPLGDGPSALATLTRAAGAKAAGRSRRQVVLPPLDAAALREEDSRLTTGRHWKRYLRVGVVRDVAPVRVPPRPSRWRGADELADGSRVWSAVVEAPGATGLRVRFRRCSLPKDAELTVADADDSLEVYGPLRTPADGRDLLAPTVLGERVLVSVRVPADALDERVDLVLDGVAHRYRGHDETFEQGPEPRSTPRAGGALSCMNSIACDATWSADVARAVGRLEFTEQGSVYLCTGTLLNDSDDATEVPYFLTANHCVSTDRVAKTVEVWWDYRPASCNGIVPFLDQLPRTVGATLLGTSAYGDISLLRLTGSIPAGRYFAGWTTTLPALREKVVGVHHPQGTHLRISYGELDARNGEFHTVVWDDGVTAQGSSGSPLFTAAKQVVGQLCCGESFCNDPRAPDDYGRFDVGYDRVLRPYLGDGGVGAGQPDAWDPGDDLSSGATDLGTPGASESAHGPHTLVTVDAEDWFSIDLVPGEAHTFEATGSVRGDLFRDAAGTDLAASDAGLAYAGFAFVYAPPAGGSPVRHWLRVRRASPGIDVSYLLTTARPASVVPLAVRRLRAEVRRDHAVVLRWRDRASDELGYRVELEGPEGFVQVGRLPADARKFVHAPGPGRHVYRVSPWNAAGAAPDDVGVRVRGRSGLDASDPVDDNGAGATYLGSAAAGGTVYHELDKNDAADWYRIDLQAGVPCVFSTEGSADTVGAVFGDAGGADLLVEGDDVGSDRNFRIEVTPQITGSYWVRVTAYPSAPRGTYRLVWSAP